MLSWPIPKDPDEVLDFDFDWGQYRLEQGETITASDFLIDGTAVLGTSSIAGGITKIWVSGGTPGEACKITNRVTTSEGRVYDQTATLRIRAL